MKPPATVCYENTQDDARERVLRVEPLGFGRTQKLRLHGGRSCHCRPLGNKMTSVCGLGTGTD